MGTPPSQLSRPASSSTLSASPQGAWKPSLNISTVLSSIQLLMSHPNPDDGLMVDIVRAEPCQATLALSISPVRSHVSALLQTHQYIHNRPEFVRTALERTRQHASQAQRVAEPDEREDASVSMASAACENASTAASTSSISAATATATVESTTCSESSATKIPECVGVLPSTVPQASAASVAQPLGEVQVGVCGGSEVRGDAVLSKGDGMATETTKRQRLE